ncbi:carboxymuconolactone decarboxylase family protein [Saccharicrinis fermentans]|uniref:Uncharacterized protein n=1 Tax=Saccharicrinis fermentans DSM 9555 = JCM 21142 TaxID=869213 RepID=W7Y3S8_9BACT|nr:hypothetical protein [Saccharicrinis fermentans]GAF05520.1 hypothetical protein JCM21142_104257 [Saccharicrinis fermentans DSM 9555 = JCM 21142]
MTKKISRYPVPQLNELPEDVQAILNGAKEKFGFVPNVVKALSHPRIDCKVSKPY